MTNPREDRYADVMPPPGWQPKSDYFKAIWAKAEFNLKHKRLSLTCPCCGETLVMSINFLDK